MAKIKNFSTNKTLPKSPTGIQGLDQITEGGLPKGRPTLICGSAGCGKTLLSMEFLVRGATQFNEPGVFMCFEEKAEELATNVASLGFDIDKLIKEEKIAIDHVHIERNEIEETGEYDLDGLFIRLGYAIDSLKAKRVVIDTVETLFGGLSNAAILRSELKRLFNWLKEKGVTTIITGERGEGQLTRQGLEEYVSDCVILLDHRVNNQHSTRRMRIVKYRGSSHGTNEYPFLIDKDGISVIPITSLGLTHEVSNERVPTGITKLDDMLGGRGYYRGSSVLISGTAGTGKSSIAAHFVDAACRRKERVLYFAFEESPHQITRNMHSIGLNLNQWVKKGLLEIHSSRPTLYGLEMHLAVMHKTIREFLPQIVIVDPINNLIATGSSQEVRAMLVRLIDFLKMQKITALFTNLTSPSQDSLEETDIGLSSLMDTWLLLRDIESGGERNRALYILKSRGMSHSNQIREFLLSDKGIDLIKPYLGPEGVLTGSARLTQEAKELAENILLEQDIKRQENLLLRKRKAYEARLLAMQKEFELDQEEMDKLIVTERLKKEYIAKNRKAMAVSRKETRTEIERKGS
jgi:circadian clock protein KaiC